MFTHESRQLSGRIFISFLLICDELRDSLKSFKINDKPLVLTFHFDT